MSEEYLTYLFEDIQAELRTLHALQQEMFKCLPEEEFQKQMTAHKLIKRLSYFTESVDRWNMDCFHGDTTPEFRNFQVQQIVTEAIKKR